MALTSAETDWAGSSPGPALGAALAEVDLAGVANERMPEMLIAHSRQLAYAQARMWQAMVQLGRCARFDPADPGSTRRRPEVTDWAGGEVSAALAWTGMAADRELTLAETVVARLPLVFAALGAGRLDRAKAMVFADCLDGLPAAQIEMICAALVPLASGLTTGQLRARLVRMIHDVDPDHARVRYRRAVRERAVVGYLAPDGTVTVSGSGLPADEAARACARLDALATKIQHAGHPGRLGQIQTDLYLGLLDGSLHHLDEAQIIAAMLARVRPEDTHPASRDESPGEPVGIAEHPTTSTTGRSSPSATTEEPKPAEECQSAIPEAFAPRRTGPRAPVVGVEIRIGLATLLGLDERCGEIPGLGPVPPDVARALVVSQRRGAQWCVAVTDTEGYLLLDASLRRRPALATEGRACVGGVVELHIGADELIRLSADHDVCGAWAGVVAEIADRYAHRETYLAALDQHPGDRFARDALARHVQIRDRFCAFPTCRRPARQSEIDHTRDHAGGGTTTRDNLGPRCARHHGWKSKGWWGLTRLEPGLVRWRSPLGRTYDVPGEPIRPPTVPPCPRLIRSATMIRPAAHDEGPILRRPPPKSRRRSATSGRGDPDEPPPF